MQSDPTLLRWYRIINRKFFDGQCPDSVCIRWATEIEENDARWEDKYFGSAWHSEDNEKKHNYDPYHDWEIILSRKLNVKLTQKVSTIAHEMCHLATKCKDNHGPAFSKWHEYITARGIFRKHALVKGLTIF